MASFARGDFKPGINQLQAFQNKTRAQIVPENPALAVTLTQAAQKIMDALQNPSAPTKDNRLRVTSSVRLSGGKHRFTVLSEPGEMYTIQTSTDLIHWTLWTNSISSTGTNQFIDVAAPAPQRFYRVVK
jgi:hypothetical protein